MTPGSARKIIEGRRALAGVRVARLGRLAVGKRFGYKGVGGAVLHSAIVWVLVRLDDGRTLSLDSRTEVEVAK